MKVYITASNRWTGLYFANVLRQNGHTVMSTWHDSPMQRTSTMQDIQKTQLAAESFQTIKASDALVVVADPDMVPGGKFVDVGVALGRGLKVILVGRRENLKMYDPTIRVVEDGIGVLKELT